MLDEQTRMPKFAMNVHESKCDEYVFLPVWKTL